MNSGSCTQMMTSCKCAIRRILKQRFSYTTAESNYNIISLLKLSEICCSVLCEILSCSHSKETFFLVSKSDTTVQTSAAFPALAHYLLDTFITSHQQ